MDEASPEWLAMVNSPHCDYFRYESAAGSFIARLESLDTLPQPFWYAYRKIEGVMTKAYLGQPGELTYKVLDQIAGKLSLASLDDDGQAEQSELAEDELDKPIGQLALPQTDSGIPRLVTRLFRGIPEDL